MEKRTVNLKIENKVEDRKLQGYASVFSEEYTKIADMWGDTFNERIVSGAFKDTLEQKADDIFMLVNHNWDKVVGRSGSNLKLTEDEHGLRFELQVPNTVDGNDLLENVRLGLIRGCSFGFNVIDSETRWLEDEFYRDITKVDLFEITATAIPAYSNTEIACRSDLSLKDIKPKTEEKTTVVKEQVEVKTVVENRNKKMLKNLLKNIVKIESEEK
ncbi:HK97 family phage prohead protease [Clostridium thermobutyricum]|uniref:Caudovirus prohead protease n=1 Tax=Clostridium thermobutyricum DSM 4928 TaxID=1121339 RepID=A0A1V4SWV5_9CLOT|nr:HK97 family phage prohead protease [Clostridium thermobutyricum]OPX47828.1 caudovirus prohead protease [Clostridium thermobutyricum DSM 4928]